MPELAARMNGFIYRSTGTNKYATFFYAQIDPTGRWFACPMEIQQRVWPTEDYELARSLVGDPEETESAEDGDLFAGVREQVLTP